MSNKYISKGYKENGYDYISDHSDRMNRYHKDEWIREGIKENRLESSFKEKKGYWLSDDHVKAHYFQVNGKPVGNNFKVAGSPYSHQAHHLIPQQFDSFLEDDEAKQVLRKSGYDINVGHNIIMLPSVKEHALFTRLPKHCGNHPEYNEMVIDFSGELENALLDYLSEFEHGGATAPQNIEKKHFGYSERLWKLVSQEVAVGVTVNELDIE